MKLAGIISTAALSLLLATAAAPLYAQEQHEDQKDQQEQKDKPSKPEEKKAQPEAKKAEEAKPAKPEEKTAEQEKNTKQEEKTTHEQQAKAGEQSQHGRIPDDKFRANFGREHTFRVSQADYRNHRFQYGGYSFGFVGVWPSNWLYTQDVFVVDIGGVYYLCNPVYPGVNLALSFTL